MSEQRTSSPTQNESPQNTVSWRWHSESWWEPALLSAEVTSLAHTSGRNLFASFTAHCLESGQGDSDEICH
jgi:hypothetical protein